MYLSATSSRRSFLRGVGTLIALPLFESLLPRSVRAQAAGSARRLVLFHGPAGIVGDYFFPKTFGTNFALPPTLSSLADLKNDLLILSNMSNGAANRSPAKNGQGKHSLGMATLFTGANLPLDVPTPRAATSVDQLYAQSIAGKTPVGSLQLARAIDGGDCDPNYVCADIKTISWANPTTPLTPQTSAHNAFQTFFAGSDNATSAAAQAAAAARNKSILDGAVAQAQSLQAKLSAADGQKLDQYLTAVRAVEARLAATPSQSCRAGHDPGSLDPNNIVATTEAMMDLMVLALQCDLTRVISFSFGNGHNNAFYGFLPNMPDGQHGCSHIDNVAVRKAASAAMEGWQVSMIGRFLRGIKAAGEADGSILSNTVAIYSSELADGNAHNYDALPVLVAGQGGGIVDTGRHLQLNGGDESGDLSQLYLAILQGYGTGASQFGDFNVRTPLPGLRAS